MMHLSATVRAKEMATKGSEREGDSRLTRTAVRCADGTKSVMLPSDPVKAAKILESRRRKSPATRVKAKLAADLAKRTGR